MVACWNIEMKKLPSIAALRTKFPPKSPEEVSGDFSDQWYFMLADGDLIGSNRVNHFEMMQMLVGKTPNDHETKLKLFRLFYKKYQMIRVGFHLRSRLYVEVFGVPTQKQRRSIATLVRRTESQRIAWDFDENYGKSAGDRPIGDFLRALDSHYGNGT